MNTNLKELVDKFERCLDGPSNGWLHVQRWMQLTKVSKFALDKGTGLNNVESRLRSGKRFDRHDHNAIVNYMRYHPSASSDPAPLGVASPMVQKQTTPLVQEVRNDPRQLGRPTLRTADRMAVARNLNFGKSDGKS